VPLPGGVGGIEGENKKSDYECDIKKASIAITKSHQGFVTFLGGVVLLIASSPKINAINQRHLKDRKSLGNADSQMQKNCTCNAESQGSHSTLVLFWT
jgi:hypothetical protein